MVNDESLESITDLFLLPVAYLNRWKLPGADELEDHLVRIRKVFGATCSHSFIAVFPSSLWPQRGFQITSIVRSSFSSSLRKLYIKQISSNQPVPLYFSRPALISP